MGSKALCTGIILLVFELLKVQDGFISTGIQQQGPVQKNYAFINGKWFDGKSFSQATFYSLNGLLTKKRPSRVDSIIDLDNKYIIPPFSEAHNHNIGGRDGLAGLIKRYLKDGVFYVKNPNNIRKQAIEILDTVNIPESIDFSYANGGLTASAGHPIKLYEDLVGYGSYPGWTKKEIENEGYFIVNNEDDLIRKWDLILAGKPKFIKTYLLCSEEYEKRKNDSAFFGSKGLDPRLLPIIVKMAHKNNLRVTTHVETSADFHNAILAGVDEVAHTPGYLIPKTDSLAKYQISDADARLAAKNKTFVVTTTLISTRIYSKSPDRLKEIQSNQKRNIQLLLRHKVNLAIGSDAHWTNAVDEALNLSKINILGNLELLKIWCEQTPQTIFPGRKIGYLKQGHEASFLVLDGNPLDNFQNIRNISLRVKQGTILKIE